MPVVLYQFGDFSLHCGKFELCRKGRRLKLERKPLELLVLLVSNHGRIVTRDEIAARLWEREVFVDIEHGINTAIRKIRQILDDSSDLPQFVQTISGSGYRFIAPVTVVEPEVTEAKSERQDATGEIANGQPEEVTPFSPVQIGGAGAGGASGENLRTGNSKNLAMRLTIAAAVLVAGLGAAIWYLHRPLPPPRITEYVKITRDGHEKLLGGTDGSRIYFTEFQPNSLNQVGVAGGEVVQIPAVPGFFWLVDVSPDGSNLLVTSHDSESDENSLWIVRALGGTSRRLGNGGSGTFSPDGNAIAYATGPGELWLVQSDGTGGHKLASIGGDIFVVQWSPDGKVIRFNRDAVLWQISANGSSLHEVLPGWRYRGRACCGRWTPDGKFYIFLTTLDAYLGGQIWALDERRGLFRHPSPEPVQLTTGPIGWRDPIPGKGMNKIFSNGKTPRGELSRFDPKTKQLQPILGGISAQDVSFSKDGRFVAYVSYPEGILWKANRDGSNPVQLSAPPMSARNPRWSPDGSEIAFYDVQAHEPHRIYLVSSQGGSPQRLLPDYPGDQHEPGWSADGRKIVFAGSGAEGKGELCILDLPTHHVSPIPGSAGLGSPRWSPDGRLITAFSVDGLKVLDVAKQRWATLPVSGDMEYNAWSSDSKYIYFLRIDNGDRGVYRIRATGGIAERVADLKDWHFTGFFKFWMALDPTDAPLLLRDVGSDEIYALTLEEK